MERESSEIYVLPSKQEVGAGQGRRYPTRDQNAPIRFLIKSCVCLHNNDEAVINDALKESESAQWKAAVNKKIAALDNMRFWTLAGIPTDRKTLRSKFIP